MDMVGVKDAQIASLALGAGDPVVLLHGLVSGNMASWYFPMAVPLSADHKVILYDQRGHGSSSPAQSGYDLATQSADLDAIIRHHDVRQDGAQVSLVGHSMGALIALHFALQYPGKVRRLVLVDAPLPASRHVLPSLRAVTSKQALDSYIADQFPHPTRLSGRRRERLSQRLTQFFFESTLVNDVHNMGAPSPASLAALTIPVLLLYGQHSPCASAGHYLQRTLADARLVHLDCSHYVPEEAPHALLDAVAEFLTSASVNGVQ